MFIAGFFLKLRAPNTRAGAVTAATIGENQKAFALLVAFLAFVLPPRYDTIYGECRSLSRRSDDNKATVCNRIVETIGNGDAFGV